MRRIIRKRMAFAAVIVAVLLGLGTAYYHHTEGWSYIDSFYFSTMTLTTIGYGDLAPVTDTGKIFTSFYAIFGIGIMLYILSSVIGFHVFRQEGRFSRIFSRGSLRGLEEDLRGIKAKITREPMKEIRKQEREMKSFEKEMRTLERKVDEPEKEMERQGKEIRKLRKKLSRVPSGEIERQERELEEVAREVRALKRRMRKRKGSLGA